MASDEQAHLTAITANLDEHEPRLNFADWLDETAILVGPQFS
jgi:uncharacterized protein (TIGR02996 family)